MTSITSLDFPLNDDGFIGSCVVVVGTSVSDGVATSTVLLRSTLAECNRVEGGNEATVGTLDGILWASEDCWMVFFSFKDDPTQNLKRAVILSRLRDFSISVQCKKQYVCSWYS